MKCKGGFLKKFLFFIVWILSTVILIALSYWLVGAIPKTDDEVRYFTRLLHVFQNPFAYYFNEYTPIGMIVTFIVTELLFGVTFVSKIIAKPSQIPIEEDTDKSVATDENEKSVIKFVEKQDVTVDEVKEKEKKGKNAAEKDDKDDENEIFLREDLFLKLFNFGYTMSQINAMMELTTYIPDIDVKQLAKMFKPSMNEDEIRGYIENFFG